MSNSIKNRLLRAFKIIGIGIVSLVLIVVLIPEIFPGYVATRIKQLANENIKGNVNFSKARLSLINHFPSLTLSLYNFSVKGSEPFAKDTLIAGKELAFGIDVRSLVHGKVIVNKVLLNQSFINVQVDSSGTANYNIYKSAGDSTAPADTAASNAQLKIEKITIKNSTLVYNDRSLPMSIDARRFSYEGTGDLSKSIFDLQSTFQSADFNFTYDGTPYVLNKDVHAKLVTIINTHSLSLKFEKNDLLINQLPVDFKGSFDFLKNGYAIDLRFNSGNTSLRNIFTVLPPAYLNWLDNVELKGDANMSASVIGNYIASTNTNPAVNFNMQVRNGFVRHKQTPEPITNLFINFKTKLPNLNTDSLQVDIDTIAFNINSDYFHAAWHSKGVDPLAVNTQVNSKIDLAKLNKATGIDLFEMAGAASIDFKMNGIYKTGQNPNTRRADTITTSIPSYSLDAKISNGFFKYAALPQSIKNIALDITSSCATNDYHNITLAVKNINAQTQNSYVKGFFTIGNLINYDLKSDFNADVNLAEIKQAIPLKDIELGGELQVNVKGTGKYEPSNRIFPAITSTIKLENGSLKTGYYPNAISNIAVDALITDNKANLADLKVAIKPLRFQFEGEPFSLNANLENFDNLIYNVTANGSIDIAKIYKVFSQKGIDARGFIKANVALKGSQADAVAGKYEKLSNKGNITIKDFVATSENYPKPFYINSALFTFNNDKINVTKLLAKYAGNNLQLDGQLSNLINYFIQNGILKGELILQSDNINVQDFMVFGSTQPTAPSSGVVLLPANLSMAIRANAKLVDYNGLQIKELAGKVLLDSGRLQLDSTKFRVADAIVNLRATYASITPRKANFSFQIKADSFDIHKAYNEVKLFHDLATSAANAYGLVSLNYKLKGRLNDQMMPVYPSLTGGGILQLENIKVNGLKLFSALSKASGKDSLGNPNLKKIAIKTSIASNIINIERVKFKVMGFRPRFEGQTTFDGQLNLKGRLGLPPLGIIGLPFSVTGTSTNPVIKMRKNEEELAAKKDEEEEE